jgi:hypothetical protein
VSLRETSDRKWRKAERRARKIVKEILARFALSQHPQALHLRGTAALQQGRVGEAVPLMEAAVRAEQRNSEYH